MTTLPHRDDDALFDLGLRALREEEGTLEQAIALEQHLLERLGPEALAAPAAASRRTLGAWTTKLAWIGAGSALLIGLGLYLARDEGEPTSKAATTAAPAPSLQAPLPSQAAPIVHPPATEASPPAIEEPPSTPVRPARVDELTLMQRARDALQHDPKIALRIAERHARMYPAGVFAQEREVLAINALLRQRRTSQAHKRAERFVAAHEDSPYAVQLRTMLAQTPTLEPEGAAPGRREP